MVALEVTGADADCVDFDQGFTRARDGNGDVLEAVILAAVDHHCLHRRVHRRLLSVFMGLACLPVMRAYGICSRHLLRR